MRVLIGSRLIRNWRPASERVVWRPAPPASTKTLNYQDKGLLNGVAVLYLCLPLSRPAAIYFYVFSALSSIVAAATAACTGSLK